MCGASTPIELYLRLVIINANLVGNYCVILQPEFAERFCAKSKKMNFSGIVIGISAFLCIGIFHPIVIKAEYYFGTRCWWVFLLFALCCVAGSLFTAATVPSTILGVIAFSSLWSILELFKQRKRVEKGWFPKDPKRDCK